MTGQRSLAEIYAKEVLSDVEYGTASESVVFLSMKNPRTGLCIVFHFDMQVNGRQAVKLKSWWGRSPFLVGLKRPLVGQEPTTAYISRDSVWFDVNLQRQNSHTSNMTDTNKSAATSTFAQLVVITFKKSQATPSSRGRRSMVSLQSPQTLLDQARSLRNDIRSGLQQRNQMHHRHNKT